MPDEPKIFMQRNIRHAGVEWVTRRYREVFEDPRAQEVNFSPQGKFEDFGSDDREVYSEDSCRCRHADIDCECGMGQCAEVHVEDSGVPD